MGAGVAITTLELMRAVGWAERSEVQHFGRHVGLRELSYGQIWCMPMKSSGDLVLLFDLFSVNEFHTCNDLCQVFEAA